jgi:predicted DNA-binding transcriptional regulator YafY
MLNLLRADNFVNADTLASSLNCSKRTIFRDLRLLNSSGIKISFDESQGGYIVDDGPQLPNHGLADVEILSLLMAARLSPLVDVPHFAELSQRAQNFLIEHGGPELKKEMEVFQNSIVSTTLTLDRNDGQKLRLLIKATTRRTSVIIELRQTGKDEIEKIVFHPKLLAHAPEGWVITGRCESDDREIDLRLENVVSCKESEQNFEIPKRVDDMGMTLRPEPATNQTVPRPYLQLHRENSATTTPAAVGNPNSVPLGGQQNLPRAGHFQTPGDRN